MNRVVRRALPTAVVLLLAIPRVARLACARVWIEDEGYLSCARLLHRGLKPFVEVPLLNFPQLDQLLGLAFGVFSTSIRTAEVCTQAITFGVSLLLWRIGKRLGGNVCGVLAGVLFATSALAFRYHVFEREYFVIGAVLGATWLVVSAPAASRMSSGRCVAIAVLLSAALTVKLTALGAVVATIVYLAAVARQRRAAILVAACVTAFLLFSTLMHYLAYGDAFLVDLLFFRIARAPFGSLGERIGQLRKALDCSVALGAAGLVWTVWVWRERSWALPVLHVVVTTIYLAVLNGSFWPHNAIEILPWLALLGAHFIAAVAYQARPFDRRTAMAALVSLAFFFPLLAAALNPNRGPRLYSYGFDGWSREEIDRVATFVRQHSLPQQPVAVPPIIALEADRDEIVPFPEITGVLRELQQGVAQGGYLATLRERRSLQYSFWQEVDWSRTVWIDEVQNAVSRTAVPVVINTPTGSPVAYLRFAPAELLTSGYVPSLHTEHFTAWIPRAPVPNPAVVSEHNQ